jgi:hypothetical protein
MYFNCYECPKCGKGWGELHEAMPDDDCPKCGYRHISPVDSEEYGPVNTAPIEIAIVMEGGCVVDVYCKQKIEWKIFDYDDFEDTDLTNDEQTAVISKQLEKYNAIS